MIILTKSLLLGEGNERACYLHPEIQGKCIKVNKPFFIGKPEQSLIEYDYYQSLKNRGVEFEFIPQCYGFVETNMGEGLVFERIETVKGRSLNLRQALNEGFFDKDSAASMAMDLYRYLVVNGIALSDISQENLIYSSVRERLYLVDGIGARNYDYKYISKKYFVGLARWKTRRQWKRYSSKLEL